MKKIFVAAILLFFVLCIYITDRPEVLQDEELEFVKNTDTAIGQNMHIYIPELKNGYCVILRLPTDEWALINCGSSEDFPVIYEKLTTLDVKVIDYLILLSTEDSSLGGIEKTIRNFDVCAVYISDSAADSEVFGKLSRMHNSGETIVYEVCDGTRIYDFDKVCIDVVSSFGHYLGSEVNSLCLYVAYANNSIFVEGDCDIVAEAKMAAELKNMIKSDILIVSRCGTQAEGSGYFMDEINPGYSVIPVWGDNTPSPNRLDKLKDSEILRTDLNGDISFCVDGNDIDVKIDR